VDNLSLAAHLRSLANPIGGPGAVRPERVGQAPEGGEGPSFGEVLESQIAEVNGLQLEADESISDLATGRSDDLHTTMIAVQKADVSFKLLMAVRNKLLDAYDEVMRMQV
jgi:flagellar hook-basal body complex protein FliE